MASLKTYRDPKTKKVYTSEGEHISSPEQYTQRVKKGEISGEPRDISKMSDKVNLNTGTNRFSDTDKFSERERQTRKDATTEKTGDLTAKMSGLDAMKNQQDFLNKAKDIIRRKQEIQRPISEEKAYWRTLERDTSPFGGKRDPRIEKMEGVFSDKDFRKMSPEEQSSVRSARRGAAQAHLQGLSEKEQARQTREENILGSMANYIEGERAEEERRFNRAMKRASAGMPVEASEFGYDEAQGNKIGGTVSWRNNNPGNIKYGDFAKKYGAEPGTKATDGGQFANFPDVETGMKAMKDLLTSKNYRDLTLDQALKKWSNKGYGAEITDIGGNTKIKDIEDNPELMDQIVNQMIRTEGWKEGQAIDPTGQDDSSDELEPSPGQKTEIMQSVGLSQRDVQGWGVDDWNEAANLTRDAMFDEALDYILNGDEENDSWKQTMSAEDTYAKLQRQYGNFLNSGDLSAIMNQAGAIQEPVGMYGETVWKWKEQATTHGYEDQGGVGNNNQ